jgi:hypothetical protein
MLKMLFSKNHVQDDEVNAALELAHMTLMNRVNQVIQATTRKQEKHSTLTSLRPLHG